MRKQQATHQFLPNTVNCLFLLLLGCLCCCGWASAFASVPNHQRTFQQPPNAHHACDSSSLLQRHATTSSTENETEAMSFVVTQVELEKLEELAQGEPATKTSMQLNGYNNHIVAPSPPLNTQPAQSARQDVSRKLKLTAAFAFWAGVADVFCYRRHGCYANMMTGNTIQAAHALASGNLQHGLFYGSLLLTYVAGFGTFRFLKESKTSQQSAGDQAPSRHISQAAGLAWALFAFYEYLCWSSNAASSRRIAQFLAVPVLGFASAMVNAASVELTGGSIVNMMTGNYGKAASFASDWIRTRFLPKDSSSSPSADSRAAAQTASAVIGPFLAGVTLTSACLTHSLIPAPLSVITQAPYLLIGSVYAALMTLPKGASLSSYLRTRFGRGKMQSA